MNREFSVPTKRKIQMKSGGKCVICRVQPGQVHHINKDLEPPKLNEEDNGVVLCQEIHHLEYEPYQKGAENSEMRRRLKLYRDQCYKYNEDPQYQRFINEINDLKESKKRQNWLEKKRTINTLQAKDFPDLQRMERKRKSTSTSIEEIGEIILCEKCGKEIEDKYSYCSYCGTKRTDTF